MAVNITILTHTQRGLEVGGFSEGAPAVSSRLVIATYNIRYAVGSFLITGSLLRRLGIKATAAASVPDRKQHQKGSSGFH
ncbi:MAG: hypothetical protein WKF84_09920 [Pyrinomonadaceae bacterium]